MLLGKEEKFDSSFINQTDSTMSEIKANPSRNSSKPASKFSQNNKSQSKGI